MSFRTRKWAARIEADLQLFGPKLTLTWAPQKAFKSTGATSYTATYYITKKMTCKPHSNKKKKIEVTFHDQCVHLTLRFVNDSLAAAWLALLKSAISPRETAVKTTNKGKDDMPKQHQWTNCGSYFKPAEPSDCSTQLWTLQWVWVGLRDFAGQVVYYETHKWHLVRRSLLVLAVDLRKAHDEDTKQRMCWWLHMIREQTREESCTVLVGTHCDKLCNSTATKELQEEALSRAQNALLAALNASFNGCDPKNLVADGKVFAVSSHTLHGIDNLATTLQTLLTDSTRMLVGRLMPGSYFELEKIALTLAQTTSMVTLKDLRAECERGSGTSAVSTSTQISSVERRKYLARNESAFTEALRYLHDSGTALWFEEVAPEYVFIRPQWLTKLFAMIEFQKHKGKCTLDRLSPQGHRMLVRQGLLRLDLLRLLWKHSQDEMDPDRTLSAADEQNLKSISLTKLVSLLCLFKVFREISWTKSPNVPAKGMAGWQESMVTEDTDKALAKASSISSASPSAVSAAEDKPVLPPILSPNQQRVVFVPCMLDAVWGRGFGKWWEPWYITPLSGQRVMAVRLEIGKCHYSGISLMPDILKGVLPHLDLAAEPILASDGLSMHSKVNGLDGDDTDSMATMMYMRCCQDGRFRVDVAVRRPLVSSKLTRVPLDEVTTDRLCKMVLAKGWYQLAETIREHSVTGKKLSTYDPEDIRVFYHISDDDMTRLMPAVKRWKAQGVPQQASDSVAASLQRMSQQLWLFVGAIAGALHKGVLPLCRWLVLSPPMIASRGLPMHDRPDVGWPFGEVSNARKCLLNLFCRRTNNCVDFRELFAAEQCELVGGHVQRQRIFRQVTFSQQERLLDAPTTVPSSHLTCPPNPPPAWGKELSRLPALPVNAKEISTSRPALGKQTSSLPSRPGLQKEPSRIPSAASANQTTKMVSPSSSPPPPPFLATSACPLSPSLSSAFSSRSPTGEVWLWPAPAVLDDQHDKMARKLWRWHFISRTHAVNDWVKFSSESSRQLNLILSHWASHTDNPPLRVENGDQQLSQVWLEFAAHKHVVDCVCFDNQHGGLLQISALAADGWIELCCLRTDNIEYPWKWNFDAAVIGYMTVDLSTEYNTDSLVHCLIHLFARRIAYQSKKIVCLYIIHDLSFRGICYCMHCTHAQHHLPEQPNHGRMSLSINTREWSQVEEKISQSAPRVLPVPEGSLEWIRVKKKLHQSLPAAKLTRLERVQNPHTWRRFHQHVASRHDSDGGHIHFTRPGSAIQELWHYSKATESICNSKIG